MIKESEVKNNTDTHAYMKAALNMMFTQMHTKKGINISGKRDIDAMIN